MPSLTIPYQTEAERRDIERAVAHVAELHQSAQGCPLADPLEICEGLALDKGRAPPRPAMAWPRPSRPASMPPSEGGRRPTTRGRPPGPAQGATLPLAPESLGADRPAAHLPPVPRLPGVGVPDDDRIGIGRFLTLRARRLA